MFCYPKESNLPYDSISKKFMVATHYCKFEWHYFVVRVEGRWVSMNIFASYINNNKINWVLIQRVTRPQEDSKRSSDNLYFALLSSELDFLIINKFLGK